jgi:hypothetical protein
MPCPERWRSGGGPTKEASGGDCFLYVDGEGKGAQIILCLVSARAMSVACVLCVNGVLTHVNVSVVANEILWVR